MRDVIHLLPESLANQIAAGEVVQRPSSVVKELLENSIDAGSSQITLIIKNAGKSLIQVVDDGKGMSETDARMCFERHATSKIADTEDLFKILTFGFRGEALASIAAVAQVELKTCQESDETGVLIEIEGSEIKRQEPVMSQTGTTVSVKNLFFNVPARRNFLKSNPVEMRHIIEEFQRVALSNPEINMSLYQDDLETLNLKSGKLAKRIVSIFGKQYQDQLIPCREEVQHVLIEGYIGKPESAKKTRGEQFFFVNGRYVKHPYLHHAIMNAYEELLPEGTFPFYALKIDLDPVHVDINVHPTKTEVKFDDERTIYAVVSATIKQALASNGITPSIDFDLDVNYATQRAASTLPSSANNSNISSGSNNKFTVPTGTFNNNQVKNWQKLYPDPDKTRKWENEFMELKSRSDVPEKSGKPLEITFSSAANEINEQAEQEEKLNEHQARVQKTLQIKYKYIVAQVKSGLMVINQQAAHERILYDQFINRLESGKGISQKLVFPQTIELPPADCATLIGVLPELHQIGFELEPFGQQAFILRGIPAEIKESAADSIIESFLEQIKMNQTSLEDEKKSKMAKIMAKKASLKEGDRLHSDERQALIEQLFASSNPNYSPDGKKIIAMLGSERLDELFM
ncbi:DNA mismatch repair endonuclease MutL [Chondrinema litorale]|uniref:DNA mismatch repair endonuclease MutL n=1 Tax=Chondrinema litorale TaxID=2994555 RepID=UPI002544B9B6|nr:DNA mismatch repair endonuclease MutL [Chondrinema litorale]UZR93077.1 DNA mismatch repair endonuclease MutL [Chondrinema litorale]